MIPVEVLEIREIEDNFFEVNLLDKNAKKLFSYHTEVSPSEIEQKLWSD